MGIHNYIIPMNTGDFTHTLNNMTFPHYKYTVVYYDIYRSRTMALYQYPVTAGNVIHVLHNYIYVPRITYKHMVVFYDLNRLLPMALYTSHTIIGAPVDRSRYLTHSRALPTFYTTPQNALKIHGRVL